MQIRCPHCHQPIELVDDDPSGDVMCSSCGSRFNLAWDLESTQKYNSGEKTIGHFQLLHCLGQGSFGSVWKARDTELDRTVAIKIPRSEQLSGDDAEKFLREARAAAQVRHPNIVSVHEVGREDGQFYIASDFVDGASLNQWFEAHPPTVRESVELCAKIADALHHAHEAGVVHRDLKPQNILMDMSGEPHVTDFGLAKRDAGEVTMTVEGAILGTPVYMPPEQARVEAHTADRRKRRLLTGSDLVPAVDRRVAFPWPVADADHADSAGRTAVPAKARCPTAPRRRNDLPATPGSGSQMPGLPAQRTPRTPNRSRSHGSPRGA